MHTVSHNHAALMNHACMQSETATGESYPKHIAIGRGFVWGANWWPYGKAASCREGMSYVVILLHAVHMHISWMCPIAGKFEKEGLAGYTGNNLGINFTDYFTTSHVTSTRGHSCKLFKPHAISRVRSNFFSVRIIDFWNNLPNFIIQALLLLFLKTC